MRKKWKNMSAQEKAQENPTYAKMSRSEKESYNNFVCQLENGRLLKEFKKLSNNEKSRFNPKWRDINDIEKMNYNKEAEEIYYYQSRKDEKFVFKDEFQGLFSATNMMVFFLFILPAIMLIMSLFWVGANNEPSDYRKCLDRNSADLCKILYPD